MAIPALTPPTERDESSTAGQSGETWQTYVNRLLATHFAQLGHSYVPIPDTVAGDGGLEGFATTGDAFQSYADEGSLSTSARTKKQRAKVTRDLRKLATRSNLWRDLLQGLKISRWYLVVPSIDDKAVLVHARKKGEHVRKLGLPFLAADFQALVVAANEQFPVAAKTLLQSGCSFFPADYVPSSEADITAFELARTEQMGTLDGKLRRVRHLQADNERQRAMRTLLRRYLDAENLLARLRSTAPLLWEQILVQRQEHANNLMAESIFDSSSPNQRVRTAKDRFCAAITSLTRSPVSTASETIANGAIGLWLLECPLDFPEVMNA